MTELNGNKIEVIEVTGWEKKLLTQLRQRYKPYSIYRLDLSIARANQKMALVGDSLTVLNVSDSSASAALRFNKDDNDPLPLYNALEMGIVFHSIFITNTAQPNKWIDIIAGVDFSYKKKIYNIELWRRPTQGFVDAEFPGNWQNTNFAFDSSTDTFAYATYPYVNYWLGFNWTPIDYVHIDKVRFWCKLRHTPTGPDVDANISLYYYDNDELVEYPIVENVTVAHGQYVDFDLPYGAVNVAYLKFVCNDTGLQDTIYLNDILVREAS